MTKRNKCFSVILILLMIGSDLLVTFFKVNADYFKYNYKFDESELVEAEVFDKQRRTIKQSADKVNLNFWYEGEEYLQECWRGLFEYGGDKTCLHVIKTVETPDTVIFVRDLIIPFQYTKYILLIIFCCISFFIRHLKH